MLADPESAVRMFHLDFLLLGLLSQSWQLIAAPYQVEVACGKHGAASGMSSGKGYYLFLFP
jgi:hypothetical protein